MRLWNLNLITTPTALTGTDAAAFNEARAAVWGLVHDVYSYVTATARRSRNTAVDTDDTCGCDPRRPEMGVGV